VDIMALDPAVLASLISAIYDAALDESLWPQVLERISAFVHGPGAMNFCYDAALKTGQRFYSWGDDPDYTRSYFEHYAAISPFLPAQLLLDVGEVKSVFELVPQSEFVETRFYREWAKPQGYVDNVFAILDKSSKSYAAIAVTRDTKAGIVDEKTRENMRLIAPHVRRAVMIGNVIDMHKTEAAMPWAHSPPPSISSMPTPASCLRTERDKSSRARRSSCATRTKRLAQSMPKPTQR
jgi:hypothetical protein